MDGSLPAQTHEEAWEALSDLFVDNEVDIAGIAARLAGIPPDLLEEILFDEVAPYCAPNLLAPVPPVWSGFAREPLLAGIKAQLQQRRHSRLRALAACLSGRFWRWRYAREWRELRQCLARGADANFG
ncbi:MAG: hypothetical protein KA603_05450 [Azonexus sp.]|jgi:hypothetical protein|nr:hypothetical protein [Betaproteobacteria bacterium]MBK8917168.1 hypothetical protein [Betaproteobacteria bacterium]MBP6035564.1 hypothetical protein [Azonexus sp.]MBP6906202.1 hypothetical protein [Azonexus sp.]